MEQNKRKIPKKQSVLRDLVVTLNEDHQIKPI